jgi:uncharacterized membrane-anchored protein YjiN (DUF445 family)
MAPRKFNEKKAVEMLEKHALKTMWGRVALREAREKIEDYVYLKNSIDACITRPVTDAVGRLAVDKDLKQLFDRIDYVKEEVRDHLETMRMTIKYPKMASEWIQRAISGINKTVDTRYEKVNNIKGMDLNTRLFVLGQKVYGYFTPDDEELVIDQDLRDKLSKTQHIQDVNQIMQTTNKLNDSNNKLKDVNKKTDRNS